MQVFPGPGVVRQQPQHAVGNAAQNVHPGGEHLQRVFVVVVEGTEHKLARGQTAILAAGGGAVFALAVANLIDIRHVERLFAVEAGIFFGNQVAVGDDIINPRQTCGGRQAQIGDLHRRRAQCQHAGFGAAGLALQIDENINLVLADELGNFVITLAVHGNVMIYGRKNALAQD